MERPIRYLRDSFFYGRSFVNDDDLNEQAERWVEDTANVRRHGTTGERPVDRFERDEQIALRAPADHPYRRFGVRQAPQPAPRPLPTTVNVQRRLVESVCGGGAMMMPAGTRRDRLREMLADLKMPGALEAIDGLLAQADSGTITAAEAIEQLLDAKIALRNNRYP